LNAGLGDVITASVKEAAPDGQVQKGKSGEGFCPLCGRGKKHRRRDGTTYASIRTRPVLINDTGEPVGTRVFGPVARELREKKFFEDCVAGAEVL